MCIRDSNGTDPTTLRIKKETEASVSVSFQEDTHGDTETYHGKPETGSLLVLSNK